MNNFDSNKTNSVKSKKYTLDELIEKSKLANVISEEDSSVCINEESEWMNLHPIGNEII